MEVGAYVNAIEKRIGEIQAGRVSAETDAVLLLTMGLPEAKNREHAQRLADNIRRSLLEFDIDKAASLLSEARRLYCEEFPDLFPNSLRMHIEQVCQGGNQAPPPESSPRSRAPARRPKPSLLSEPLSNIGGINVSDAPAVADCRSGPIDDRVYSHLLSFCDICKATHMILSTLCDVGQEVYYRACELCGLRHRWPNPKRRKFGGRRCQDYITVDGIVVGMYCSKCHRFVWKLDPKDPRPVVCPKCRRVQHPRRVKFHTPHAVRAAMTALKAAENAALTNNPMQRHGGDDSGSGSDEGDDEPSYPQPAYYTPEQQSVGIMGMLGPQTPSDYAAPDAALRANGPAIVPPLPSPYPDFATAPPFPAPHHFPTLRSAYVGGGTSGLIEALPPPPPFTAMLGGGAHALAAQDYARGADVKREEEYGDSPETPGVVSMVSTPGPITPGTISPDVRDKAFPAASAMDIAAARADIAVPVVHAANHASPARSSGGPVLFAINQTPFGTDAPASTAAE